jgi:hypothetical protein
MKRLIVSGCLMALSISLASAGSESYSKESVAPAPCPAWYAEKEWNLNLWGGYAFTDNHYPAFADTVFFGRPFNPDEFSDADRYLGADHAWGAGVDLKYFFCRYFGIGLEGFGLNARRSFGTVTVLPPVPFQVGSNVAFGLGHEDRVIGGLLGTFSLRYPIGCSRFAPYAWVGGGGIFGGGDLDQTRVDDIPAGAIIVRFHQDSETKWIGQFGGGMEVRITPHIGWTNDFSWNVVNGSKNNFGLARTGINFAF